MYRLISNYNGDPYFLYPNLRQPFPVVGKIREKWEKSKGVLGDPVMDAVALPYGGVVQNFQGGNIYYVFGFPEAYAVYGMILNKYASWGYEKSLLGYPISDEKATPDGEGRYNHFQGGSIYLNPSIPEAFVVNGAIRDKWAELGWEKSQLGYPESDAQDTGDFIIQYFQGGSIRWNKKTGKTKASIDA